MTRREALALILLILLGLTGPVVLLVKGMTESAVRRAEWETYEKRIPYAGTARELYEEHEALLNAAVEILWAHPEFFEQYRQENENDASFPLLELWYGKAVAHPFTEDEWQVLQRLAEQRWLSSLWYEWGRTPALSYNVETEEPGSMSLIYIRSEGVAPGVVQEVLRYQVQLDDWYERIGTTDWYISCYNASWT